MKSSVLLNRRCKPSANYGHPKFVCVEFLCVYAEFPDESQEDCSQDPPAADRVDGDVPIRLQGREDDAEPEGADPPAGQWR